MRHLFLQLHITGKCNLCCGHCYIGEHSADLSYGEIRSVLKQFSLLAKHLRKQTRESVAVHVHMTGGEPFLHPEINRVLRYLTRQRHKYRVGIMSNGTLLMPESLAMLKRMHLKAFQVSVDGTERTHDALRGKGNFEKVINALDLLHQWGIPTRVSFTAHRGNYREFPQVAEICRAHHVNSLWSDRYIPFSHNEALLPLDCANMQDYTQLLQSERCSERNAECGLSVQNSRALQFLCSGDPPYHCSAGEALITVDEHGNILPCRRLPFICGNIRTDSLADVYQSSPVFQSLRAHETTGKCLSCKYGESCKGGERCFTFAMTGKTNVPDPCCWVKL